jgi:hypothetical protein
MPRIARGATLHRHRCECRGSVTQHYPCPLSGASSGPSGPDDETQRRLDDCARERERERDASATLTRPITDSPVTHRLPSTLFPKENTRKTTPSQIATRSLSQGPRQNRLASTREPTQTRPYVRPHPYEITGIGCLYMIVPMLSSGARRKLVEAPTRTPCRVTPHTVTPRSAASRHVTPQDPLLPPALSFQCGPPPPPQVGSAHANRGQLSARRGRRVRPR